MNTVQRTVTNKIAEAFFMPNKIRLKIMKWCGMNVSNTARIMPGSFFDTNLVSIGDNSFVNRFCQFHDGGHGEKITIKENCMIAMNVNFCAVTHKIGSSNRRAGKPTTKEIIIESGSWIGANSTILQGVTVGEGCVIAAGAVVTKDCEPNGLYGGVPAKRIKDLH